MLAVFTGARHGELNGLRWTVTDLKRGRVFINRSLTGTEGRRDPGAAQDEGGVSLHQTADRTRVRVAEMEITVPAVGSRLRALRSARATDEPQR